INFKNILKRNWFIILVGLTSIYITQQHYQILQKEHRLYATRIHFVTTTLRQMQYDALRRHEFEDDGPGKYLEQVFRPLNDNVENPYKMPDEEKALKAYQETLRIAADEVYEIFAMTEIGQRDHDIWMWKRLEGHHSCSAQDYPKSVVCVVCATC
ncbi:hypothetical protein MPER_12032, partial [Moniliophthora perniciosa FA553]